MDSDQHCMVTVSLTFQVVNSLNITLMYETDSHNPVLIPTSTHTQLVDNLSHKSRQYLKTICNDTEFTKGFDPGLIIATQGVNKRILPQRHLKR